MYKKDYLLRIVEQLQQLTADLLGLTRTQQYDDALELTSNALRQRIGLGSRGLLSLSTADLVNHLQVEDPAGWQEKSFFAAAVLQQEARVYAAQEREAEAAARYLKALELRLAASAGLTESLLPPEVPAVDDLLEPLRGYVLPGALYPALLEHYLQAGRYAQAEDVLFQWRDADPHNGEVVDTGLRFYQALQRKSDRELAAGDLPREEVEAGLADFLDA